MEKINSTNKKTTYRIFFFCEIFWFVLIGNFASRSGGSAPPNRGRNTYSDDDSDSDGGMFGGKMADPFHSFVVVFIWAFVYSES